MTDRIVLVGIDNPQSNNPAHALYPHPPNCAGWRLMRMMRLDREEYLRLFDRDNLFPGSRDTQRKKDRLMAADELIRRHYDEKNELRVFCMGKIVASWLCSTEEPMKWATTRWLGGKIYTAAYIPHPSGRSRFYNVSENKKEVEHFLHNLVLRARRAQRGK